uniref:Collagenase NC10/endostatin domain-containing protein n=1 Tax=Sphaeramia orbicularis TaxID=375764 RepID=A0A673CHX9_9TELE
PPLLPPPPLLPLLPLPPPPLLLFFLFLLLFFLLLLSSTFQCYQQARSMGLTTTYRAFLSSHLQDLATIVRKADRVDMPVQRMSIFSGNGGAFNPATSIFSFDGRDVLTDPAWPEKLVWPRLQPVGIRLTTNYCEAWRTADMAVTGQAAIYLPQENVHNRKCFYLCVLLLSQ